MDAPTADDLRHNAIVLQTLADAWRDSLPDDPALRHEEGGWIYLDTVTGSLTVRRAQVGGPNAIDLSNPPWLPDRVVVGKFHTHPNPSAEGWNPGPSRDDVVIDDIHGVPDLIHADNGIHVSGPASRRGGLSGGPGYPP